MRCVLEVDGNSPGMPSSKNCLLAGRICTNPPSTSLYSLFLIFDLLADDLRDQDNSNFHGRSCPIY